MTECPPGCGMCRDPVRLRFRPEDMQGPSGSFAREHWTVTHTGEDDVDGSTVYVVRCAKFDPHGRTCTAYGDRPPICSGYPWYGDDPDPDRRGLNLVCVFQADVRGPILPIVAVTHGR